MLQVGLGLVAYHKPTIERLHEYKLTPTYHELRRLKTLSAVSNTGSSRLTGAAAKNGFIQVISDNFHAHIHTQNELKQTKQNGNNRQPIIFKSTRFSTHDRPLIPRLVREKIKDESLKQV